MRMVKLITRLVAMRLSYPAYELAEHDEDPTTSLLPFNGSHSQ